jgi:methyl-accepting chemotaxis protein
MRDRLLSLSWQARIVGLIGLSILIVTALELLLLPRPAMSASLPTSLPYPSVLLAVNGLLFLAIAALVRRMYRRHIQAPLRDVTEVIRSAAPAAPGMDAPLIAPSASPEIRQCADAALSAWAAWRALVDQLAENVAPLAESSQALLSSSQAQASRLEFQHSPQQELRRSIHEVVTAAKPISQAVHAIADLTAETARIAQRGHQTLVTVSDNLEEIQRFSRLNAEKISALEQRTDQIHDVVATIDSIIEDTKLIAFNATIEAARTKDEGKGFGVVAAEIKRLAEEVFESTEEIKDFIQESQRAAHALARSTESEGTSVQRGRALAEESELALHHIVELTTRASASTRQILASTEQQQQASEQALGLVENATRALDQLGREMRASAAASEQVRQHVDALVHTLRPPWPVLRARDE